MQAYVSVAYIHHAYMADHPARSLTNHHCWSQIWVASSPPAGDEAPSWSRCDTEMLSCLFVFRALWCEKSLFIYFLFRLRLFTLSEFSPSLVSCWSQSHTSVGSLSSLLLCRLCQFDAFWVGGHIYCTKSSLALTQKRQALLMLSQPLNYFRPLPRRKQRWHWAQHDETESMMGLHPALWGEWKNKLKTISNPIPNVDCIEWALSTNRHLMYSQTWRKKITFEL